MYYSTHKNFVDIAIEFCRKLSITKICDYYLDLPKISLIILTQLNINSSLKTIFYSWYLWDAVVTFFHWLTFHSFFVFISVEDSLDIFNYFSLILKIVNLQLSVRVSFLGVIKKCLFSKSGKFCNKREEKGHFSTVQQLSLYIERIFKFFKVFSSSELYSYQDS